MKNIFNPNLRGRANFEEQIFQMGGKKKHTNSLNISFPTKKKLWTSAASGLDRMNSLGPCSPGQTRVNFCQPVVVFTAGTNTKKKTQRLSHPKKQTQKNNEPIFCPPKKNHAMIYFHPPPTKSHQTNQAQSCQLLPRPAVSFTLELNKSGKPQAASSVGLGFFWGEGWVSCHSPKGYIHVKQPKNLWRKKKHIIFGGAKTGGNVREIYGLFCVLCWSFF